VNNKVVRMEKGSIFAAAKRAMISSCLGCEKRSLKSFNFFLQKGFLN
jgi:hypothetical protein